MTGAFVDRPVRAALFDRMEGADKAVETLLEAGFGHEQITVICSEETCRRHFRDFEDTHTADRSEGGPAKGGVIGLAVGGVGSAVGVATTGGAAAVVIGSLLAGGITGTLLGTLVSRGIHDEIARFYEQGVSQGKILIAVEFPEDESPQRLAEAEQSLAAAGAKPFELSE